jgi:hypothetical protein
MTPTWAPDPAGGHEPAPRRRHRRPAACLLALALPFLAGNDQFAAGVRAYRAGRTREALAAFVAAERAAGDPAPPELLFDLALAALASGDLRRAEIAAEKAAAFGPAPFTALRDFVLGNAAFARCGRAELQASAPDARPAAFDRAIAHAVAAQAAWQRAAASRDDWPQARRNVERAQQKLADLREKKREAQQRKRTQEAKPDKTDPEQPDGGEGKQDEIAARPQPADAGNPQIQALLDLLLAKEKEKRDLRRARQRIRGKAGEKAW